MPITKEQLADLSSRTYGIAENILVQLNGTIPNFNEKFYYGILARQVLLLDNITKTLISNNENALTSVFILFRCLLDDFITILYFQTKNFDEKYLIANTSNAFRERFKIISISRKINEKYFAGNRQDLVTPTTENQQKHDFIENTENDKYFKNKTKFEFKSFPSVTEIVDLLPNTDLGKANAHAFILWKHLSHYVHYSLLTYQFEKTEATRNLEINQLKEALSYCYKTIVISKDALKKFGKQIDLSDPSNVWGEINN